MNTVNGLFALSAEQAVKLAKTDVCGAPVVQDGKTVIPVSSVSVGFACGGDANGKGKNVTGGSGMKVTVTPTALLVFEDGEIRVVPAHCPPPAAPDTLRHAAKALLRLFKKK